VKTTPKPKATKNNNGDVEFLSSFFSPKPFVVVVDDGDALEVDVGSKLLVGEGVLSGGVEKLEVLDSACRACISIALTAS
jgi:hypothetical protein